MLTLVRVSSEFAEVGGGGGRVVAKEDCVAGKHPVLPLEGKDS